MSVLIVTGFIIHILLHRHLGSGAAGINLLTLMTINIALVRGKGQGQSFGFFSGLLEDLLTAGLLGERVILRTLLGFTAGGMKGKFSEGNVVFQFFMTFILIVIYSFSSVLLRIIFGEPYTLSIGSIILYSALNALVSPVVYKIIIFIYAR